MPVNVPNDLPAIDILRQENIFVMTEDRAVHQDIRPLEVLILNLMEFHTIRIFTSQFTLH